MEEVLERLFRRRRFGMKLGLHVEEALLDCLGNPERHGLFVHVAGTNGKGSVASITAAVLTAAGYRTGLYTSPHLVRFNERFVVDGQAIPDDELMDIVGFVEAAVPDVIRKCGQEPTFFECSTAIAFEYFRRCNVDIAVIETGMGGRLDATNIVKPIVCAITRIGLEHTEYLGNDLATIASEKAGIIKPGVPVVAGAMADEALGVIRGACAKRGCALVVAAENVSISAGRAALGSRKVKLETDGVAYGTVEFGLVGDYQLENLATAISVVDVLRDIGGLAISEEQVRVGVGAVTWPGRCQVLETDPPVILDGAHNPDGARALATVLDDILGNRPLGLVVGMCGDKDIGRFLKCFSSSARKLWAVGLSNERGAAPLTIANAGTALGIQSEESSLDQALCAARAWALAEKGAVCITGSLFLVGDVLGVEK